MKGDGAIAQSASVRRAQAVAATARPRDPDVTTAAAGPAALLRAAGHQQEGGA